MTKGIYVSDKGDFGENKLLYDSRDSHYLVSLVADPPHLDRFKLKGGTLLSVPANDTQEEVIYSVDHELDYTPECLVYFYLEDVGTDTSGVATEGRYSGSVFYRALTGAGSDLLLLKVNNKRMDIVHRTIGDFAVPVNSVIQDYTFTVKYYIFSLDSGTGEYETELTTY